MKKGLLHKAILHLPAQGCTISQFRFPISTFSTRIITFDVSNVVFTANASYNSITLS